EEILRWLQLAQQALELSLQQLATNRFAIARTAVLRAQVVRVPSATAGRPACSERRTAIGARDEATQREILTEIFPRRHLRVPRKPILDFPVGLEADQRFVVALAQGHIPSTCLNVSGIDRPRQQARDILIQHDASPSLRE